MEEGPVLQKGRGMVAAAGEGEAVVTMKDFITFDTVEARPPVDLAGGANR